VAGLAANGRITRGAAALYIARLQGPCYDGLREKLARTEAALLIDLHEAAQIVYQAVWADPSPTDPSRTYHSAAQALLNELCQRAGIMRLPGAV
jgi:hypothetical protein